MDTSTATTKLSAIASVRPEMAPVIGVALAVAKSAEAEVAAAKAETARATRRAELAEDLVRDVRPHLADIERRAEIAEQACDDMAADTRKRIEKQAEDVSVAAEMRRLEKSLARLEKQVEDVVPLIVACHKLTRDANGKSVFQNWRKYAGGPWSVLSPNDGSITLHETRKDAIQAVREMLLDKKADIGSTEPDAEDSVDSPRRRRQPQPGENPPAKATGRVDLRKIVQKRCLKAPRIL